MPEVKPSEGFEPLELADYVPYKVSLVGMDKQNVDPNSQYSKPHKNTCDGGGFETCTCGNGYQIVLDWELYDEEGDEVGSVRDWIRPSLSMYQGNVSKLQMVLNAVSDRNAGDPIDSFNTDTWVMKYDGGKTNKLVTGMEVLIQGVTKTKKDENTGQERRRFNVKVYQRVNQPPPSPRKKGKAAAAAAPAATPAAAPAAQAQDGEQSEGESDDDLPF